QFWDLAVHEDRFEVGLSFGGIPERLAVPFSAIKSFFDPSVQFGLQFETADTATETIVDAIEVPPANLPASPVPAAIAVPASQPDAAETAGEPAKPGEGAEVVRLDRFRKK